MMLLDVLTYYIKKQSISSPYLKGGLLFKTVTKRQVINNCCLPLSAFDFSEVNR